MCFPRFDSPSIFGRLLGAEAGYWSIRAMAATQVTRRYLDRTMALETTFRTPTGAVAITGAPGVRPAPGVWAGPSPVRCCRWWSGRVWGRRRAGPLAPVALTVEESAVSGQLRPRRGESAGFALHHAKRAETGSAKVWSQSEIGARFEDTVSAWESWSELHQGLRGSVARPGTPQRTGAPGTLLRTHRRDLRSGDHLAT